MAAISTSTIYQPLDKTRKEIRIAMIAPEAERTAPVEVNLEIVSLYESPQYTALSYCWASLDGAEDITLCGHKTSVGKNLWEALRQFRSERSTRRMWIDALCINQNDIQERSSQVALMRELYSKASNVRVWLGPATSQTEIGFNYLRFIMNRPDVDVSLDHIPGEFNTASDFLALGEIFRNPYWRRRWITQEIFLSQWMFIHCGRFTIGPYSAREYHGLPHITEYIDKCQAITRRNLGKRGSFFNIVLEEGAAVTSALIVFADPKRARKVSHLSGFFGAVASVDHDYVYGLLGLLPEDIGITSNYELDVKEVFTDFAFRFMRNYNAIHLLYLAGHSKSDLPSWVPDLRQHGNKVSQVIARDSDPDYVSDRHDDYKVPLLTHYADFFNASAGAPCGIPDRVGEVLVISGLLADKIIAIGEKVDESDDGFGDLRQTFEVFARWRDLHRRLIQEEIFVDKPICDKSDFQITLDFIFTICDGVSQDLDDPHRPFRRCTRPDFEEYMIGLFWNSSEYPEDVNLGHMHARLQWLDLLAARNTFFVTATGRMGLATGEVLIGDHICILAGLPVPLRLRSVDGDGSPKYAYQSCAYVQGIMDGEAVLEAASGDQDRVTAVFKEIHLV